MLGKWESCLGIDRSLKRIRRLRMAWANAIRSLNAPTEVVKQIIVNIEAGVEVEVTIAA